MTGMKNKAFQPTSLYYFFKRGFDVIFALTAIILSLPLMLILVALIKMEQSGPAIYKHKRVGYLGKEFCVYKFRTMFLDTRPRRIIFSEAQREEYRKEYKIDKDPRITKVGKFLRKTSLDELPQFFNILLGDMSFVGPRPITQSETSLYGHNRHKFLSAIPGLTGYWQVNGRNNVTYEKRMNMELHYVMNQSFFLDMKILAKTVVVVLFRHGAK